MENNKIINGNCWVAYFDILGFKGKTSEFDGGLDQFAEYFYEDLLKELQRQCRDYHPDKVFPAWGSDTFLLFTQDDSKESSTRIVFAAKGFCQVAMSKSWPLRAAIGFGQLYVDKSKNIFLGSGLIDAYEYAEKQNWIGLVVTPKAINRLRELGVKPQNWHSMLREYNVPVKREELKNGICLKSCKILFQKFSLIVCFFRAKSTQLLFAVRIHELPNVIDNVKQMQRDAMNDKDYRLKFKSKYENTLKFFEETN